MTAEEVRFLREKFGLGMMEAAFIVKSIDIREKVRAASTFEELKEIVIGLVDDKHSIDRRYPIDEIILSLKQFRNKE